MQTADRTARIGVRLRRYRTWKYLRRSLGTRGPGHGDNVSGLNHNTAKGTCPFRPAPGMFDCVLVTRVDHTPNNSYSQVGTIFKIPDMS